MLQKIAKTVFGSRNDRILKRLRQTVKKINALEAHYQAMDDQQLSGQTEHFKSQLAQGKSLNSLLPEAFAVVREASKRVLELRHFDVQLIAGMVLHEGKISEMRTGEGKTLAATLPLYLHALTGKGAHLVTVNDYLARRDAGQMSKIYGFLGLSTGVIVADMDHEERKQAYACDITYGTNNEFGFDYLRDNMAFSLDEQVQRGRNFAVVDEVDSILIDEARTPLIISGAADDSTDTYNKLNDLIPKLVKQEQEDGPGDYYLDEKSKQAFLTEEGHQKMEQLLVTAGLLAEGDNLYSPTNVTLMHFLHASLRAHTLYHRDVDYLVKNQEVMIVDEHTGRAMPGRRWSEGLHQAVEAKEGVPVQGENQTLASITYQNFFRLYGTLAGMTGTADTEAFEFHQIYGLEVVIIPTNKPMVRKDHSDKIYLNAQEKFDAIVTTIEQARANQQPVLVGTASIETSEYLDALLTKAKVPHQVLNAKQHAREAKIIAQAGKPGEVTIATNMAGRGTDIVLGGNWQEEIAEIEEPTDEQLEQIKQDWQQRHDQVIAAGGLYIIGSERHESRRIDNQLRGRAGRQGDPGESQFFLSLEDNLVRIFAPERLSGFMRRMGMGNGEAIESKMVSRSIANAQKKVESFNFDIRKSLLEYDDVANDQRQVVYKQRQDLLEATDVSDIINAIRQDVINQLVDVHMPPGSLEEQWSLDEFEKSLRGDFAIDIALGPWLDEHDNSGPDEIKQHLDQWINDTYNHKIKHATADVVQQFERMVLLQSIDNHWREHLSAMDHLRGSINLRGYAQKDPKQEYKKEAFALFSEMLDNFRYEVVTTLCKVEVNEPEDVEAVENQWRNSVSHVNAEHAQMQGLPGEQTMETSDNARQVPQEGTHYQGQKIGRNAACPCGSGKKFKHCHGKIS